MIEASDIRLFGEHAVLITWEAEINLKIHKSVLLVEHSIRTQFPDEIIETVPSYHAIAIYLKPHIEGVKFIETIKEELVIVADGIKEACSLITIPVCYDASIALDIVEVCSHCKIAMKELIKLHTAPTYTAYFLGFLPGFPYLGGLDSRLETPRLKAPREKVPKGSVAIGGKQTGIYPSNSPGGWNIIGNTPISLFDIKREAPSMLLPGDSVRFRAISKKQFASIARAVENGTYEIEKEVCHD